MFFQKRDSFDKFTERAKKVLSLAQAESQRMQHNTIGSEHILLGLVREGEGVGARILQNLGVDLAEVREAVREQLDKGNRIVLGEIGLTKEGKRVVEQAVDEARRLNHHYIGTEHLLLAITSMPESVAAQVLAKLGANRERVRAETLRILSQSHGATSQRAERKRQSMFYADRERLDRDRFDKFTEDARKILSLAQEEAQRFQHNYIGTEHLLLGLVRLEESTAGQVLHELGIQLPLVRSAVEFIIGRGDRIVLGEIGLTPRAKKVIELAVDEARRMQHHYIGTEHILLGLVREGEGIAAGVLESLGVKLEQVRTKTVLVIEQSGAESEEGVATEGGWSQTWPPLQNPLMFASAYVRGAKQIEPGAASPIQDADDLVPAPATSAEHGNRLTLRLRRVLVRAGAEAQQQQKEQVGTQHLLLALIREQNGIAFHVLKNLKVESERITSAIELLDVQEQRGEPGAVDGFTSDGRHALELALDEARQLGQPALGTEHMLLGLLRGSGMAAGALVTCGLSLDQARAETRRLLSF